MASNGASSNNPSESLLAAAEAVARAHHSKYDPSHDFHHITRVRATALSIARSLPTSPDLLVVELAALFHDLIDAKYLPKGVSVTAEEHLQEFWKGWEEQVTREQQVLVARIVDNVSYSKEIKRAKAGLDTEWHRTCLELHW
jgi:uncharacterized protein